MILAPNSRLVSLYEVGARTGTSSFRSPALIIKKHRQVYVRQLLEFYENRTEGARELLLKMNSESEGLLFNLSRMDYLLKENEEWKIEELSPDTFANHRPIGFSFGKMQIELNPIFWHWQNEQFVSQYETCAGSDLARHRRGGR